MSEAELLRRLHKTQALLRQRTGLLRKAKGFLHSPGKAVGVVGKAESHVAHEMYCDSCRLATVIEENLRLPEPT